MRKIGLGPLQEGEDEEIIASTGENLDGWCKQAIQELGRIPRYLQFFLQAIQIQKQKGPAFDRRAFFSTVLQQVESNNVYF